MMHLYSFKNCKFRSDFITIIVNYLLKFNKLDQLKFLFGLKIIEIVRP